MASALMRAPAAKARTQASMRLESGTYRPRATPKIDDDVVKSPSSETIMISANRSSSVHPRISRGRMVARLYSDAPVLSFSSHPRSYIACFLTGPVRANSPNSTTHSVAVRTANLAGVRLSNRPKLQECVAWRGVAVSGRVSSSNLKIAMLSG